MSIRSPKRYEKSVMGYYLDMRSSMGRIANISGEWCKAFDVGDTAALEIIGDEMNVELRAFTQAGEKAITLNDV